MATIKFRLSAKADKITGKCELLVRFYHGRTDQYAKTRLFLSPDSWNEARQRVIIPKYRVMTNEAKSAIAELSDIDSRLADLSEYINAKFIEAGAGRVKLPGGWLSGVVEEFFTNESGKSKELSIADIFDKFMESKEFSKPRRAHFEVCKRAVLRFLIYQGQGLTGAIDNMDADSIRAFSGYLKEEHTFYQIKTDRDGEKVVEFLDARFAKAFREVPESRLPEARGQNSISVFLAQFREVIRWAIDNGLATNNPFHNYEIPASVYGTPYYITIEERNRLLTCPMPTKQLEMQRDIFVFQCVIGCRVSDLRNLKKSCIIDGAVEYIARKTREGNPVTIRVPLNAVARGIVEKYRDLPGSRLLPCIADQNYNYAIKDVFKIAGLTRMVTILNPTTRTEEKRPLNEIASSHMARRCFIGNLYKQVKDPNLVGKLTGHKEGSRAFARYRDIDEDMRKELVTMLE